MKTLSKIFIASLALFAAVSCAKDQPAESGMQPLVIDASIDGLTRTPDEFGYEGVIKKQFVEADAISIDFYQESALLTGMAVLTGGQWVTFPDAADPATPGDILFTTRKGLTSTYGQANDIKAAAEVSTIYDHLAATGDIQGSQANFTFRHINTLLSLTAKSATTGASIDLAGAEATAIINNGGADIKIAFDDANFQSIALGGSQLVSISILLPGAPSAVTAYPVGGNVDLTGGKHLPVEVTMDDNQPGGNQIAVINVTGSINDWTTDPTIKEVPFGYDIAISTAEELIAFAAATNDVDGTTRDLALKARVIQLADIDMASSLGWAPIANNNPFNGEFNGNGYTISNLAINGGYEILGLICRTNDATLKNIHVRDVEYTLNLNPTATGYCGGLVGELINSTVVNCSATGIVSFNGDCDGGGLVGVASHSTITMSRAAVACSSTDAPSSVGGLIGYAMNGTYVAGCSAAGAVTIAGGSAGGLIGTIDDVQVSYSYSTGGVRSYQGYAGSFIGLIEGGLNNAVSYSYAAAEGTFVGMCDGSSVTVEYCWKSDETSVEDANIADGVVAPDRVEGTNLTPGETVREGDNAGYWTASDIPTTDYTYEETL